jgi:Protein of unknown function (DUF4230)
MGVVTPERERTPSPPERGPAPPAPEPPPPRRERRGFWGLVAVGLVIVAGLIVVDRVRDFLPSFDNPFATETIDRSGPAILKSIQDIGEYRAATGNFEVIVDRHQDTGLPDELLGERTLFVAAGTVDAGLDLRSLDEEAVELSDNRRTATITLPHARLYEPQLDIDRSYVYQRDEGVFNEIAGLFGDEGGDEQVYRLAEDKLAEAARSGSGLVTRAEGNTREMLESLLRSLGFTTVVVKFES